MKEVVHTHPLPPPAGRPPRRAAAAAPPAETGGQRSGGRLSLPLRAWVSYTHRLVNLGRFVEAMVKYFSADFNKHDGAAALISLAELRNRSPALCGFYDSPPPTGLPRPLIEPAPSGPTLCSRPAALRPTTSSTPLCTLPFSCRTRRRTRRTPALMTSATSAKAKDESRYHTPQFVGLMNPLLLLAAKDPSSILSLVMHTFHLVLDTLTTLAPLRDSRQFLAHLDSSPSTRLLPERDSQSRRVSPSRFCHSESGRGSSSKAGRTLLQSDPFHAVDWVTGCGSADVCLHSVTCWPSIRR